MWNFQTSNYKNKQKRGAACDGIVQEINTVEITIDNIKNRIKKLESTYGQKFKTLIIQRNQGLSSPMSIYLN